MNKYFRHKAFLLLLLASCSSDDQTNVNGYVPTPVTLDIPEVFEQRILNPVIPTNNPLTEEGIALGKKLFFDKKLSANWLGTELFGALNKEGLSLNESPITAESLGRLIELISDGTISGRIAKDVFTKMFESGEDAAAIVEKKGLTQISDSGAILELVESVISDNESKVAEFRDGKDKLFGFFVGQVMKRSQGKANPKLVNDLLKDKLG